MGGWDKTPKINMNNHTTNRWDKTPKIKMNNHTTNIIRSSTAYIQLDLPK